MYKLPVTENLYWKARRFEIKYKFGLGYWWLTERLTTGRRLKYLFTRWLSKEFIHDEIQRHGL